MRLRTGAALAVAIGLAVPASAHAQSYPSRAVTVVVSGPPGGPLDVATRGVFEQVREALGKAIVIENKAGAGGILAVTAVTRAPADGYTLLSTIDPPIVATPTLVTPAPYDPIKDLVPVAMLADGGDNVLVVPANSPAKTVSDLVGVLRAAPDKANYSSSGNGGPGHLLGALFNRQAGTPAVHVPHKGATDAVNAVIADQVSFAFIPAGLALPFIQAGKLRALAVAAEDRNPLFAELPTVAEAGVPGVSPVHWWIIVFAPADTPRDLVQRLNLEIRKASHSPRVAEMLRRQALHATDDAPEKVAERVRHDVAYWSRVIKELGITTD